MRCPTLADLPSPPADESGWMWTEESTLLPDTWPNGRPLPRVTVVTPSYNQGRFLEATIRSILLQGYPDLEYIIIDGGSSDDSVEIIKKYEPWLTYWVSEKDRGQAHALNKGFARAGGHIYAYLNSDDYFEPGALYSCVTAFRDGRQWVVGRVRYLQERVGSWSVPELPGKSFTRWFLSCPIPQPGSFWSAGLHQEMGGFREDLNYFFDYEFWLRFRFVKGIEPFVIDQPIAVYRIHPQSKTVAENSGFARESNLVREQYKHRLTHMQRRWLWVARRHRKAIVHGKKAVLFIKKGEFRAAARHIVPVLAALPILMMDFRGVYLGLKELLSRDQSEPAVPEIWPECDD